MKHQATRGLFVVGTDTGVGKTHVASLIVRRLRESSLQVGVYKPVASGCSRRQGQLWSADAQALWDAAGRPGQLDDVAPQRFAAPLAPHVAARQEHRTVNAAQLRTGMEVWAEHDCVIVEGVGGILSPLSDADLVADLVREFNLPAVIVVANTLGAINQTLLAMVAAEKYELRLAGVILNSPTAQADVSLESNEQEIAKRIQVPILANVPFGAKRLRADPVPWLANTADATDKTPR